MTVENNYSFLVGKPHDGLNSALCYLHVATEAGHTHTPDRASNVGMVPLSRSETPKTFISNGQSSGNHLKRMSLCDSLTSPWDPTVLAVGQT